MIRVILPRVAQAVPVLAGALLVAFLMIHLVPGGCFSPLPPWRERVGVRGHTLRSHGKDERNVATNQT